MHLNSLMLSWRNGARILMATAFLNLPSISMAEDGVKLSPEQATSLGIRVVRPVASPTDKTLPYPAQIVVPTPQMWVVSAPVAGMVINLSVARGDRVTAGQPLALMESPGFVSQQRDYLHAVAQDVLAAQQLNRNTQLFQGNAVAQRVLEASQAEARQASIAVAERRQMLRLSGLSDETIAKLTSEAAISATLTVAAPRPATVIDIAVSPGQRVEQSAPLIKLAQLSPLWVEIAVPALNIKAIRQGAKVEVDGYETPGQVMLVSETADAATQTVLVRAEVPNSGDLRPGQTAAARISFASKRENAWELPYSAIFRRGEQASVFVAVQGGFRLVPVTLLEEDQDHVVVSGAISNDDEVAVSGISALRGILLKLGAG
ncbi:efflux RND transporter periplasmic adaptor subunit [Bradyrhizobium guangzhouense]|uniref:Efflux RND transporter periplasmic adaptor subunit n=1 Tax=Bradyrhizobium guangzhouense TaxID=1325095 RepID=A0AAE6C914_9BRAD|nr:efflux RND transporter periplasmic adaptor subunit [Bradyrhizobium guangzhouense]QAU47097.1 efflux transporter periplasmic adaptor subunit [Bradyrhizobium guangzhouense]RXH11222.1 efflux RND transporter periplasmic adaptor subunit [Bradyrhizobium guangzhouense]